MMSVVRARKDIRSGSIIQIDWLEDTVVSGGPDGNLLTSRDQAAGKTAKGLIPEGKLLSWDAIEDEKKQSRY